MFDICAVNDIRPGQFESMALFYTGICFINILLHQVYCRLLYPCWNHLDDFWHV